MKIVIVDKVDISLEAICEITKLGDVEIFDDLPEESIIMERIKNAEVITANYVEINRDIIDSAANLKYIIVPAVGYEWVDHKYAATKGIKVINCPTHNSQAVAEHALGLLFAVARPIAKSQDSLRAGKWSPKDFKAIEVQGKKLGLIGHGNIGRRIEQMAKGLGMMTSYIDSRSSNKDVDKLVKRSDVVMVCSALNDSTHKLLDARRIKMMNQDTILINVARGAIVDTKALMDALRHNSIWGAGLDVFDDEPLSGDPPESIIEISSMKNVIATPHTAYNTYETAERLGGELLENLKACIKNIPINVVNS